MHEPLSKPRRIAVWIVSVLLALVFLGAGSSKVLGTERTKDDFERWGYPDWFRPVVGTGEILAALFLLIPNLRVFGGSLRFWGAAGLVMNMTGALFTHLRIGEYEALPFPFVLGVLAAFVGWSLRPEFLRARRGKSATRTSAH